MIMNEEDEEEETLFKIPGCGISNGSARYNKGGKDKNMEQGICTRRAKVAAGLPTKRFGVGIFPHHTLYTIFRALIKKGHSSVRSL